jgi:uncharacterized small protein (DUF1192 family)
MNSEDTEHLEQKKLEALDLEIMSIQALVEYVRDLTIEIKRVEIEINSKKEARRGAEDLFQ